MAIFTVEIRGTARWVERGRYCRLIERIGRLQRAQARSASSDGAALEDLTATEGPMTALDDCPGPERTRDYAQGEGMTGVVGVPEGKAIGLSAGDPLDLRSGACPRRRKLD